MPINLKNMFVGNTNVQAMIGENWQLVTDEPIEFEK